jgi:hypothetical protein
MFARALALVAVVGLASTQQASAGEPFVPGTGEFMKDCCDDFENQAWSYRYNHPKSSYEQDENQRSPGGFSNNGLWHEGGKRGTPDVVKRVSTPPGGIEGSTGSLLFATKNSGVPGTYSNSQQQDDLLMMTNRKLGRSIPMAWQPSVTVRVYLPEWDKWENRTGPSFGMRCDCNGRNPDGTSEEYWPGMFILLHQKTKKEGDTVHAQLTIRGDKLGRDVRSVEIMEPGWWTLGMSFTPDGQVHYYGHQGVADLTKEDHLLSSYPYSMKCLTFNNFFFNVANWDTGRTWSTPWIIDDPKLYVIPPAGQTAANLYKFKPKSQMQKKQQQQVANKGSVEQPESESHGSTASKQSNQKRGRSQR